MSTPKWQKRQVRERMARTGESYMQALSALEQRLPEPAPRCCCKRKPKACPLHRQEAA